MRVPVVNAACEPNPSNPQSWLPLVAEPATADGSRLVYGVLRPEYRGRSNSAAAFVQAKLQPVPPIEGGPWSVTAHRVEVLLPEDADDRFGDPRILAEAIDLERPANRPVLLACATITLPATRLHRQWEVIRGFARAELVEALGLGVIAVQHAPHRAGSDRPAHVHLLVGRKITSLGLAGFAKPLCGDGGFRLIAERLAAYRAEMGA